MDSDYQKVMDLFNACAQRLGLGFWLLDEAGQNPVAVDMATWSRGMRSSRLAANLLIVRQETVGRSWISTVFMTVGTEPRWETMIWGGKLDEYQAQCTGNREQAEAMHADTVKLARRTERFWLWKPALEAFLDDQFYDWR